LTSRQRGISPLSLSQNRTWTSRFIRLLTPIPKDLQLLERSSLIQNSNRLAIKQSLGASAPSLHSHYRNFNTTTNWSATNQKHWYSLTYRFSAYIILSWHLLVSFPCFVIEPSLRSCHLYAGSPSWQLVGYIYMTCPFRSLTPPVLNYNRVSYDTSTMVHS